MYLSWNKKTITDFSDENINHLYNEGYVFTRVGKGVMNQTRSVRINLDKFELSSENKRVLRKTENATMEVSPLPDEKYSWEIGKLGKDFYEKKFGNGVFTANKIKELMTAPTSNFNLLLTYTSPFPLSKGEHKGVAVLDDNARRQTLPSLPLVRGGSDASGYAICFQTKNILHYCYPFYDLSSDIPNLGIGMMTRAVVWAKEQGKKYIYLGSAKDASALYKTQFKGFEWWDGKIWKEDVGELKNVLK